MAAVAAVGVISYKNLRVLQEENFVVLVGGEIDEDEEVGEFMKFSIGFRICCMSSSRYSVASGSSCSVWFSSINVVVEVEVVETTVGEVLSLAIVCWGNVGISVSSNGAV